MLDGVSMGANRDLELLYVTVAKKNAVTQSDSADVDRQPGEKQDAQAANDCRVDWRRAQRGATHACPSGEARKGRWGRRRFEPSITLPIKS
jgi:hypothetical protein